MTYMFILKCALKLVEVIILYYDARSKKHQRTNFYSLNSFKSALYVIPGFGREVTEHCSLLGYYAASSGNFLPTFRDNLSVPYSRFKSGVLSYLAAEA